ncbi:hypothetical protein Zm00014a_033443 [Zea mays]|uniref:Uncharacterized protein n=1 Tax=Zea mays TaxID=4577 RepID=A0A3L6ENJ0_MAIZE|nr:hypothetical protein Zm00014a_033443 [Zea mays]
MRKEIIIRIQVKSDKCQAKAMKVAAVCVRAPVLVCDENSGAITSFLCVRAPKVDGFIASSQRRSLSWLFPILCPWLPAFCFISFSPQLSSCLASNFGGSVGNMVYNRIVGELEEEEKKSPKG